MVQSIWVRVSSMVVVTLVAGTLTGCFNTGDMAGPSAIDGVALKGLVRGGQQPVTGAKVYLFAAGTAGYTSLPTSLLAGTGVTVDSNGNGYVLTDGNGNFSLQGDITCPSASSQVYVEAIGGNPGLAAGTNNAALAMMAALGSCGSLNSGTYIFLNEVTTVGAAYALGQFANIGTTDGFSTSSTNVVGFDQRVRHGGKFSRYDYRHGAIHSERHFEPSRAGA